MKVVAPAINNNSRTVPIVEVLLSIPKSALNHSFRLRYPQKAPGIYFGRKAKVYPNNASKNLILTSNIRIIMNHMVICPIIAVNMLSNDRNILPINPNV